MWRSSLTLLALAATAAEPAQADRIFLAPAPSTASSWSSHRFVRLAKTGAEETLDLRLDGKPILVRRTENGILLDRDRDGAITDADRPVIEPLGGADMPWTFAGRPATYRLRLERLDDDYIILGCATELVGRWRQRTIRLVDADVDGSFTGFGEDRLRLVEAATPRRQGWTPPSDMPTLRPLLRAADA